MQNAPGVAVCIDIALHISGIAVHNMHINSIQQTLQQTTSGHSKARAYRSAFLSSRVLSPFWKVRPVPEGRAVAAAAPDAGIHCVGSDVCVGDSTAHVAPKSLAEQRTGFNVPDDVLRIRQDRVTFQILSGISNTKYLPPRAGGLS
jgi:hypothetical protein